MGMGGPPTPMRYGRQAMGGAGESGNQAGIRFSLVACCGRHLIPGWACRCLTFLFARRLARL